MVEIVVKEQKPRYQYNIGILKRYGKRYKVSYHKMILTKGITVERRKKGSVNTEKLDCNIRRAKSRIKEYALCNDWDYFCTLTLNKEKQDRYDISLYIKQLSQFIRNLRKKTGANIQYLLIPEQHKDGAWHMHGLLKGIPDKDLVEGMFLSKKKRKRKVYNWVSYSDRFGFTDLEKIESLERVSSYITKYITKDLENSIKTVNSRLYYSSRGLETSVEVKRGVLSEKYRPDYEKKIDKEVIYSEMWVSDSVENICNLYVYDNSWSEISQTEISALNW